MYTEIMLDVFSVFGSPAWVAENIKTFPRDFEVNTGDEFIRVSVLTSGQGVNLKSTSGMLLIDIFTVSGDGPSRAMHIANRLDAYLVGKSQTTQTKRVTQFMKSSLAPRGVDKENPSLSRYLYSIEFNHYGVP